MWCVEDLTTTAGYEDGKNPKPGGAGSLNAGKDKEGFTLRVPRRNQPCQHLDFTPRETY